MLMRTLLATTSLAFLPLAVSAQEAPTDPLATPGMPAPAEDCLAEGLSAEECLAAGRIAEQPAAEEPTASEPTTGDPLAEQPSEAPPVAEQPVDMPPLAEEPTEVDPMAGEPPFGESVAEQPAAAPEGVIAEQAEDQMLASRLMGSPIVDAAGEPVGEITDLILDGEGRLMGVVITTGGFLGIGAHQVGLGWASLEPAAEGEGYISTLARTAVEEAEAFRTLAQIETEREMLRQQEEARQREMAPILPPQPAPQQ